MAKRSSVIEAKNRILSACVKMFIEKGYKETTMLDIIREAGVSAGTFQNIFHTKAEYSQNSSMSCLTISSVPLKALLAEAAIPCSCILSNWRFK